MPDKSSGHREQHIRIEYNGIGFNPIHELDGKANGVTEITP